MCPLKLQIICNFFATLNWQLILEEGKYHHSATFKFQRITIGTVMVWKRNQRVCIKMDRRKYFPFESISHLLLFRTPLGNPYAHGIWRQSISFNLIHNLALVNKHEYLGLLLQRYLMGTGKSSWFETGFLSINVQ